MPTVAHSSRLKCDPEFTVSQQARRASTSHAEGRRTRSARSIRIHPTEPRSDISAPFVQSAYVF
jgi:hypothetical protein